MSFRESTLAARPPADPDSWCWSPNGHWEAALQSIQDGRRVLTRSDARHRYANDIGERYIDVCAWKRYARACDRQEKWEAYCDSLGWYEADPDGEDGDEREMSSEPPANWVPDIWNEDIPEWSFCHPDDEGAVPVWACAPKGSRPPHRPTSEGK